MVRKNGEHVQCPMPATGEFFIKQCSVPANFTEDQFIDYMKKNQGTAPQYSKVDFINDPRTKCEKPKVHIKVLTYPTFGSGYVLAA